MRRRRHGLRLKRRCRKRQRTLVLQVRMQLVLLGIGNVRLGKLVVERRVLRRVRIGTSGRWVRRRRRRRWRGWRKRRRRKERRGIVRSWIRRCCIVIGLKELVHVKRLRRLIWVPRRSHHQIELRLNQFNLMRER